MRKRYSRHRRMRNPAMRVRHFFVRASVKWKRMRAKKRWIYAGGTMAVAAAVVLVFVLGVSPALSQRADTGADITPESTPSATPVPTPAPTPGPTPTPIPTLMPGMESPDVTDLQMRLMELGFLDIDETTQLYGPATTAAVEYFQRQHELTMDGVCGGATYELIFSEQAQSYMLLQGTEGSDVDMLQQRLMEMGYLDKATGYYGTETIAGVMAFQERNGIGVDGKTGPVTLDVIYSADAVATDAVENQERRRGNIYSFIDAAEEQMGEPYVWGAAGPDSFDCSGLVTYCLRQAGSTTGRLNAAGFSSNSRWENVSSMDDMEIGDLIFFSGNGRRVGHTGIYIGGGQMIDASSANGEVVERSCRTSYWESHFVNARRPW